MVAFAATAALNQKVYLAGGCVLADCAFPSAAAEVFDPALNEWSALPPLPEKVWAATGAALDGQFFVFGGVVGAIADGQVSRRVYSFDPRRGEWSRKRDMPRGLSHAGGAVLRGRFLLTGGCAHMAPGWCDEITSAVKQYRPRSDAWSPAPPMPGPLYGHGAIDDGDRIIVTGGRVSQTAERTADPFTSSYALARGATTWIEAPAPFHPRWLPQLFHLPRGIGMFGGSGARIPDGVIEVLGAPGPFFDQNQLPNPAFEVRLHPSYSEAPPAHFAIDSEATPSDSEPLPPPVVARPHSYAVVIGIERYRESIPRATFAERDARLTAEYFKRVLGVPKENLVLLMNERATKSDFEKHFERWLPNRVEKGDEVYVYFSGHGAPDPKTGQSFLVPFDADPAYLDQTGYPIRRLYAQLAKLPAKRIILAMDSCFSGAGGRSVIANGVRPLVVLANNAVPPGITVITASTSEQISNSYREKRHGLFTYFFLQGMRDKGSDFRAVYDELKPQVSRIARRDYNSDQVPQFMSGAKD
jgi:hypothetical protein